MHRIGITGSMGMGKSTVAAVFTRAGIPVWDADSAVADLYRADGAGTRALRSLLPADHFTGSGVNRQRLRQAVASDRALLGAVERAVHPLVHDHRTAFLAQCVADKVAMAVLEIPLLFESGIEDEVDTVIVVTAPPEVQKERILGERNLSDREFQSLMDNQMSDREKRQKADYVIVSVDPEETEQQVHTILRTLKRRWTGVEQQTLGGPGACEN